MPNFLLFDVGATNTRIALSTEGKLGEIVRVRTDPRPTGFATFLGLLDDMAKGKNVVAVAGGMVGELEGEDGHLTMATNLPQWEDIPVRRRLNKLFDQPVHILNDVMACGLGECHFGAGSVEGVMAYFTVSTGLNAVRLVDGHIDTTIERFEIGRHILEETGTGQVVSFESLVGGAAMEERFGKPPREVRDPVVWDIEEAHLAHGLYNVLIDWTPDLVVFGGSMMRDINLRDVRSILQKMPNPMSNLPRLKRAELGDTAGLLGAMKYLEQSGYKT